MPSRFYRRGWDETRGDEFDGWGCSVWYFEVGDDGWPVRQVEVYDADTVLRYGAGHEDDQFGGLGQASLDDVDRDDDVPVARQLFHEDCADGAVAAEFWGVEDDRAAAPVPVHGRSYARVCGG